MKVFISWSGERSHRAAQLLKGWLKCVLQATEPWLSSDDIERGSLWFQDVTNTLGGCNIGILCLTRENRNAPWILFEAGGLLKGLSTNRVCTFLVDLEPKDVEPPLSQFNHTSATRDSMFQLVSTLNDHLESGKLDDKTLEMVFQTYWPKFEEGLSRILEETKPQEKKAGKSGRSDGDLLTEILYTVRSMDQRLKKLNEPKFAPTPQTQLPFDLPLEEAPESLPVPPRFGPGDHVVHRAFGAGTVTDVHSLGKAWVVEVDFGDAGTHKIMEDPLSGRKSSLAQIVSFPELVEMAKAEQESNRGTPEK